MGLWTPFADFFDKLDGRNTAPAQFIRDLQAAVAQNTKDIKTFTDKLTAATAQNGVLEQTDTSLMAQLTAA